MRVEMGAKGKSEESLLSVSRDFARFENMEWFFSSSL